MTIGLPSEQIIAEIEAVWSGGASDDANVYTLKEFKKLLGLTSDASAYRRLDILEEAGMLVCTNKLIETRAVTLSGKRVVRPITAYKIVPNEKDQE